MKGENAELPCLAGFFDGPSYSDFRCCSANKKKPWFPSLRSMRWFNVSKVEPFYVRSSLQEIFVGEIQS